jgi:glycosyltransferase involved in cell wall biosynthesis
MADSGYRVLLVIGKEDPEEGNMIELARKRGIEPIQIPEMRRSIRPIRDCKAFIRLFRLIRREGPVIVDTHTAKAGILGRMAARLAGVPVIVHTFHGHVLRKYFGAVKSGLFTWVERLLARISDSIIMVSRRGREELISFGVASPEKIAFVPYGLELDTFRDFPAGRQPLKDDLGVPYDWTLVGIVGRLVPIKGHVDFLEAARIVGEKKEKVAFVIVGDGELRAELEEAAGRLPIRDRIFFAGWRHDLDAVYASLDIVVQTSYNEGLPFALIEAMASGKPMIATDVGGVAELIVEGVTGYLTPEHDPETLAERLFRLLDDPSLARSMGEAGRKFAFERFEKRRMVRDMVEFYDDLLRRKGLTPPIHKG